MNRAMNYSRVALIALMLVAAAIAGCDENVTNEDPPTTATDVVNDFEVIALNWNSVQLNWKPPAGAGKVGYRVRWRPFDEITDEADTGTIIVGDFQTTKYRYSETIDHLQPKMYLFTIQVMTDYHTTSNTKAENSGAPALRITTDAARLPEPLRLYESTSGQGNALIIDTLPAGASRIVPTIAPPGSLHLVLTTQADEPMEGNDVRIRAAYSMTTYDDEGLTDRSVWIANEDDGGDELDDWYIPYDNFLYINTHPQAFNYSYKDFRAERGSKSGLLVRIGDPNSTSYRFARFRIVRDASGMLLRGTAPNRYVEIELSLGYPGVPFA